MKSMQSLSKFLIYSLVLFVFGCAAASKNLGAPKASAKSAIIFVPGYYGTALKDKDSGDRFFITARNYLFGSQSVSLHTEDLQTPHAPQLEADGVLEGVSLIPGLYTVDVYGKFLNELRDYAENTNQELVPFPYDWRQDLSSSSKLLAQKIDELHARGIMRIQIVAHSMGCLITTYYLAYGTQDPIGAKPDWAGAAQVQKVVLMAGPYRGAFALFRNMQTGARIGSNHTYMPAETVASLPASYQLLPFRDFQLLDVKGRAIGFSLQDAAAWKTYQLGLFRSQSPASSVQALRLKYVTEQLMRANEFSKDIQLPKSSTPAPPKSMQVLQLVGSGHEVVDSAYWDKTKDGFFFDTDDLEKIKLPSRALFTDGDGSVTLRSAKLPSALEPNTTVMHSTVIHEKIFEDVEFRKVLSDFLR